MERSGRATRRQLLAGALTAGTALTGGSLLAAEPASAAGDAAATPSDTELLHEIVKVELLAVAVYEGVLTSGLLSARPDRVSRRALSQERTHVRLLTEALLKLGATPPAPPPDHAAVDKELADRDIEGRLAKLKTEHDCGSLLLDLEAVLEGVYYKAMSMLQDSGLQRLAAQILANEAQHAAAISEARRPGNIDQAAPYAFIEGRH
jgi:Ferritin-like domain